MPSERHNVISTGSPIIYVRNVKNDALRAKILADLALALDTRGKQEEAGTVFAEAQTILQHEETDYLLS